ncbi:MAG TPA: ComEC/Rec2 family competence protein, partial [Motiliproteus sp.]
MIRFCLALASVAFWPQLPPPIFSLLLLVGALLALAYPRLRWVWPLLFGWVVGCSFGQWQLAHRLPSTLEGQTLAVVGTVVGLSAQHGDFCRFELAVERWPRPGWFTPRRLRLNWYQCEKLPLPGQRWQLQLRLKRPHGYRNPGTWDRELQLLSAGIDATGYVYAVQSARQLGESRLRGRWDRWRWQVAEKQRQLLPAETAALVNALLLGDRRYLSDAQWQRLRNSGTLHLFVVSGLHIGMVALMLYRLLITLGRLLPAVRLHRRQWLAVVGALAVSLIYAWLAGFALPTQRAWIMVAVMLVGWISWQQRSAADRLGLAAALVLVLDPLAVRSAGFWLSFSAAAIILYAFFDSRRYGWWRGLLRAQWAALLGVGPCLLWVFHQLPLLAPLLNLVAIPLVTLLLLPLLLLGLVSDGVGLGPSVMQIGGAVMAGFDQALQWVEPYLWQWPARGAGLLALLCAGMGALLLLGPRLLPGRWLGWLMLLPLLWPRQSMLQPGEYAVTVLDVGQGSAVLVET